MKYYIYVFLFSIVASILVILFYYLFKKKYDHKHDEGHKEHFMSNKEMVKRLYNYAKPFLGKIILALLFTVAVVILDLTIPLLIENIIKALDAPVIDFTKVVFIIVFWVAITICICLFEYIKTMLLQKVGQRIVYEVRNDVFYHIENESAAQINNTSVGTLVTQVTTYIDALNEMFTSVIVTLFKSIITLIGVIVFMFITSVELTFYVLALSPLIVVMIFIFNSVVRIAYREVKHHITSVNKSLSENITGMRVIQMFGVERQKHDDFKIHNHNWAKAYDAQVLAASVFRPLIYALYLGIIIIVFWFGGRNAMNSNDVAYLATLVVFHLYIDKFFEPLHNMADQYTYLQASMASCEQIFVILDTPPTIVEDANAIDLPPFRHSIEFKNVWFAYEAEDWVLRDVSFIVNSGDTLALVGATGSGKTTIFSLLVRNYDVQKGQILIDGVDIRKVHLNSLRSQIGPMLQEVFLFSGTIADNISMSEKVPFEEIEEACHYVGADHFISKLPKGLHEEVKERGVNFSAGERQLLSFARAIVHKPTILILDEATANIDTETEHIIQESLEKMMSISTMLIVAHRLSTIQHADKILVLQKGEIIERGTHQELLHQKGLYYSLYQLEHDNKQIRKTKNN